MLQPTGRRVPCCGGAPWSLLLGLDRDGCGVGVVVAVAGAGGGVVVLCSLVLVAVLLERLQDRLLGVLGQQVQVLPDPGLPTADRLALRHTGRGGDLREYTLDIIDT